MSVRAVLARVGVLLLGAWVGALGAVVHRMTVGVGGLDVPWGLVLALVATLATAVACDGLVRVGAAWFGFGWTLVLLLQQVQSTGSYLVASDTLGWTFTIGGLGVCAAAVVVAPRLAR